MSMTNRPYLSIEGVEMTFNTKSGRFPALVDVNLKVAKG